MLIQPITTLLEAIMAMIPQTEDNHVGNMCYVIDPLAYLRQNEKPFSPLTYKTKDEIPVEIRDKVKRSDKSNIISIPVSTEVKITAEKEAKISGRNIELEYAEGYGWTAKSNLRLLKSLDNLGPHFIAVETAMTYDGPPFFKKDGELSKDTKVQPIYIVSHPERKTEKYIKIARANDSNITAWVKPDVIISELAVKQAEFIKAYQIWLEEKLTEEIEYLSGNQKAEQVRGYLAQIERVSIDLIEGKVPELNTLSTSPVYQNQAKRGYVPPELISVTRKFIRILEKDITGAIKASNAQVEGSLYEDATDWNARLGVPQYRTQSDNLVAPEATCNVTAFSMALERLGYSRKDVIVAIEKKLNSKSDTVWETEVESHLDTVNDNAWTTTKDGKKVQLKYRTVRGGKKLKDADEKALAKEFKSKAQMEDLLYFYLFLTGIERTAVNSDDNPLTLLKAIGTNHGKKHSAKKLEDWSENIKLKIKTCLEAGGAVMYSFFHKGKGMSGKHIITVQAVTDSGLIVDDPYGKINPIYLRSKKQDAYQPKGIQTAKKRPAKYKNVQHLKDDDDWHVESAQNATSDESLGDSYEISDAMFKSSFNYVVLLERKA